MPLTKAENLDMSADRTTTSSPGPQPLGVFPLPGGYLLLPPNHTGQGEVADRARAALVAGRYPAEGGWPEAWAFYRLALAGDVTGAQAALRGLGAGFDPVVAVNEFVLESSPERWSALEQARVAGLLRGVAAAHAELVAYSVGLRDQPPPVDGLAEVDGALAALVHAAWATATGEGEHLDAAVDAARAVSPALAAQLLGARADARGGEDPASLRDLHEALQLLDGTELGAARAELHLNAGLVAQSLAGGQRELLTLAVKHYHSALSELHETSAPELFAAAHANLATAYLTMPMVEASDQLRVGVAVQSLRSALRVYQPDTHPQQWASATLNLANSLVYLPSVHQGDNVVEAVELYEQVLAVRDRHADPLGFARVCANLGNALAHLGIFDHATGRLHEARFIFEEFQEHDAVRSIRGVLDEIAKQQVATSATRSGPASLADRR